MPVPRRPSLAERFAFLDHPPPIPFAHRGGAGVGDEVDDAGPNGTILENTRLENTCLENTMEAFQRAIDLGYRYIETDLHVTADGVLLLLHDHSLRRVAGQAARVGSMRWEQARRARVGGRAAIPQLEDVLGTWPEIRLNLDVKVMDVVSPLVTAIRRTGSIDRVCVGSFSDRRLARVRAALGPRLCTSLGPREAVALRAAASGALVRWLVPRAIPCAQLPDRLGRLQVITPRLLETAHRHGIQVHVWTVNEPDRMERLLDLGVDGIMTDRPRTLREVLRRRGQWTEE